MQAIILAAGMGRRLGEYTENNTKCMLPVNGVRLIDRMLTQLLTLDIRRVVLVIGYKGENLKSYVLEMYADKLNFEFVENPIYDKTNNIYSLDLAKRHLQEDDTLLIESDLIFEDGLLRMLVDNPSPNLALVAKYESWMDGTMVRINEDNEIVNFVPKAAFKFADVDGYYKTVNVYKFSKDFSTTKYVPFLEAYTKAVGNSEYYENVLRILSFLNTHDLKALPLNGEKWYEIDDKQDLDIAEALFADEAHVLQKYFGRYGGFWRFPQMLDYCYLVNPFFPTSKLLDEMTANFRTLLTGYPSGMGVNTLLASKCWGVKEKYIVPGNGAAELIKVLMESLTGKLGVVRPTFEEYPNRLPADRVETYISANKDFRYDADDLMGYFGTHPVSTILLINPDNPTGNFIPVENVKRLAAWSEERGIQLIVDESFVDFSENWETSSLLSDSVLEAYPHMVVMKSISKSYGVPGLRLGILASANEGLIADIKKRVSIWNINSFAEYFMQIFSKYESDYKRACEKFLAERTRFVAELEKIPFLHVMPTQANFVFCEVKPPFTASGIVMAMLKDYRILMSNCRAKKGLTGDRYMRIAVRGKRDNDKLVDALKSL